MQKRGGRGIMKEKGDINKQLKDADYVETELSEEVELNRALAYRNLVDSIYKQAVLEGVFREGLQSADKADEAAREIHRGDAPDRNGKPDRSG